MSGTIFTSFNYGRLSRAGPTKAKAGTGGPRALDLTPSSIPPSLNEMAVSVTHTLFSWILVV